jgi:hypothetical protein
MGAVKHAVQVVDGGAFAVPVGRQPPLLVGYEHFRLDRQGALLSPKTLLRTLSLALEMPLEVVNSFCDQIAGDMDQNAEGARLRNAKGTSGV